MDKQKLKEIEVKVKVNDFEQIQAALIKLECKLSEPILQEDKIYLPNGTKFTEITTNTNILRLRKQNGKNVFTLKRNSETSLAKMELETEIENLSQMGKILENLGFYQVAEVTKIRKECTYKEIEICLDSVEGLGTYIEVEKITNVDPNSTQNELLDLLKLLGVDLHERVHYGYDILIYLKDHPEDRNKF